MVKSKKNEMNSDSNFFEFSEKFSGQYCFIPVVALLSSSIGEI